MLLFPAIFRYNRMSRYVLVVFYRCCFTLQWVLYVFHSFSFDALFFTSKRLVG